MLLLTANLLKIVRSDITSKRRKRKRNTRRRKRRKKRRRKIAKRRRRREVKKVEKKVEKKDDKKKDDDLSYDKSADIDCDCDVCKPKRKKKKSIVKRRRRRRRRRRKRIRNLIGYKLYFRFSSYEMKIRDIVPIINLKTDIQNFFISHFNSMAEQSCVELAKCAFETKNLDKLQSFALELLDKPSSDKYFWAYLSLHPEIFFDVYEEEISRQLGTDDLSKLYPTSSSIELYSIRKQNISTSPSLVHGNWRQFGYDWFLSANQEEAHEQLKRIIGKDAWDTFDRLSKINGVAICGGLPSKAIYQKWRDGLL